MKFSTIAVAAALIMGTTEVKAGPRMVGIGSNTGNRAATLIASSGDISGSSYSELSADAFNALSVEELRENYDVLIFSWNTPTDLNAHWGDRLLPYLQLGGGILFEDPKNLADLSPAVMGIESSVSGPYYSIIHNESGLTNGITGTFVNSHMKFESWSSDFTEFIHYDNGYGASFATGLFGSFESSDALTCGRIVLTGPDSHYHAYPLGDASASANHYNLLVNSVNWVTSCDPSNSARPTAICKDIVLEECAAVTPDDVNDGSFDPDDGPLTSSSFLLSPSGLFEFGTTDVTLTVTDSHGAIDECAATVTVINANTPPVASCKSVEVLAGPTGQDTSVTAADINDGSSDAEDDGDLSFSLSPSGPFDIGTTDVTLTVTDACGAIDECTATVTVTNNPPIASCKSIEVSAGPACQDTSVTAADINDGSSDVEDDDNLLSFSLSPSGPFEFGTTDVTLTVTDSHGAIDECAATVTVINTPPVASCKSVEVLAGPTGQDTSVTAADINDGSSDAEDDGDLSFSLSPSGPFDIGTTDVTLTVTDACGAIDECTATVTVTNNPPIASCKSIEVSAGPACQDTSVTAADINDGSSDVEDDDNLLSFSLSPSGPFEVGTTDVTLTVTDSHGAIDECAATVTVVDDEAPVVDCGDIGVIAPCQVPLDVTFGAQPKTNGCPVTTTTVSHDSCSFCNGANKIKHRDCVVSVLGDTATITETGGVQTHISFDVTVTNDNDGLTSTSTCTICTQNPSVDFEPGCSTQDSDGGPSSGGFVCGAGFPNSVLTCGDGGRSLLRGGGSGHGGDYGNVVKN